MFQRENFSCQIYREIAAGRSIADLILIRYPEQNIGTPITPLSAKQSVILAFLRNNGPTELEILRLRCGLRHDQNDAKCIRDLIRDGRVYQNRQGQLSLTRKWMSKISIYAFEAKLTKWKAAMKQAINYKKYADSTYVVLPNCNATPALQQLNRFREENVGLVIANGEDIKIIFRPKKTTNHDWKREFIYSRISSNH